MPRCRLPAVRVPARGNPDARTTMVIIALNRPLSSAVVAGAAEKAQVQA